MRRSSRVAAPGLAFLLAGLLSFPVRADVPQNGFAPNLAAVGIRDIQHQLRLHGYDPGPDSGMMNDTTRAAILAYQRDYGLREDGVAGPALQNLLHFLRRRPVLPPATAAADAGDSVVPPAPLAALLQPPVAPVARYEAPQAQPPQAPIVVYGMPPAAPPPVRYAAPPAMATRAPIALYPPPAAAPMTATPAPPETPPPPVYPGAARPDEPPMPVGSAPPPSTLADQDAEFAPPSPPAAPPWPPERAAEQAVIQPPIPAMGDIASLAPPPPSWPDPADALLDPLAAVAIALPEKPKVVPVASAYPDPLAALAIEMPAALASTKEREPLPVLALPPPIRMPAKTAVASREDPQPVAEPRIPVAAGPLGSDPAHPLPAPAFVPPPFSTAPTDAAEPTGDAYVRQVQEYLKQLGFFHGEPDGVLDWATVESLVKFDASGAGPTAVIADPKHLDEVWIARLKTALATKGAPPGAQTPP